jgi:hypothetical protein
MDLPFVDAFTDKIFFHPIGDGDDPVEIPQKKHIQTVVEVQMPVVGDVPVTRGHDGQTEAFRDDESDEVGPVSVGVD